MSIHDDLQAIATQEKELQLPQFDAKVAWQLGTRLHGLATERGFAVVIDVRRFGQPLFYAALPRTSPDNAEWVRRKSNVVARFHRSSYAMGLELQFKKSTLTEKYGLPVTDYAAHGGAFPISVVNAGIIGSITVSGLAQRQDHEFIVEALCHETGRDYARLALPTPTT